MSTARNSEDILKNTNTKQFVGRLIMFTYSRLSKRKKKEKETIMNTTSGPNNSLFRRLVKELQWSKEHSTYKSEFFSLGFNSSLPSMDSLPERLSVLISLSSVLTCGSNWYGWIENVWAPCSSSENSDSDPEFDITRVIKERKTPKADEAKCCTQLEAA